MDKNKYLKKKNRFDGSLRFGAKRFYELSGRKSQADKTEEEKIFRLFGNPSTGLIKKENTRLRKCVCGSNNYRLLFIKHGFRFLICNKCRFIYVNPVLKENILRDFYKKEDSWFKVLQNPVQAEMDNLKFRYGLDIIEEYIRGKSLLDIGCGNCAFIEIARGRGWKCTGVEFNSKSLKLAKNKGLTLVNQDIESAYFRGRKYDLITLWEVLEHIINPEKMLKKIHDLLNNNGYLFILVPNRDSLINRMLREKSNSFTGHCHINFFNAGILTTLLKKGGFRTLRRETIISELDNLTKHLTYEDAYAGETKENFPFFSPEFIHGNLLGCKLLILAQKVPVKNER